jgi:hypothetical protein
VGLVLDPQLQAQTLPQRRLGAEWGDGEAVPVDPCDGVVQPLHEAHEVGIAPAPRARRMPGVQRFTPAHEGVGTVVVVENGVTGQPVFEQVLAVTLAGVGADEGVRLIGGRLPAAGHADEGRSGHELHTLGGCRRRQAVNSSRWPC